MAESFDPNAVIRVHDNLSDLSTRHTPRDATRSLSSLARSTADHIQQIGCSDVAGSLLDTGAIREVGAHLLVGATGLNQWDERDYHYPEILETAVASADEHYSSSRQDASLRPTIPMDEIVAHEAADAAAINAACTYDVISPRLGASVKADFSRVRSDRLAAKMPHLRRTRVFSLGLGNASVMALWTLRELGIGTSPGATEVVSSGNVGGIWNSPDHRGVASGSKNNPAELSLDGRSLIGETLRRANELEQGSGREIADWAVKLARNANIDPHVGGTDRFSPFPPAADSNRVDNNGVPLGLVVPEKGFVSGIDQNEDYSYSVTWTDDQGEQRKSETDIVIAGLGLQKPFPFVSERLLQTDATGKALSRDHKTELELVRDGTIARGVEIYTDGDKVNLKVHRWQDPVTSIENTGDRINESSSDSRRVVPIFGLGNSAVEKMFQFEQAGIPYVVITDNPSRMIRQPNTTHNVDGKKKRLSRNTDPLEFNLQTGIAMDLGNINTLVNNAYIRGKILTEVDRVEWAFDDTPGGLGLHMVMHHSDGYEQKIRSHSDVYGLYGYGLETDKLGGLNMSFTDKDQVLTDVCGQVKHPDQGLQRGYFTLGGHIAGGDNKGVIPGMLGMLPRIGFASIAQAERRRLYEAAHPNRKISKFLLSHTVEKFDFGPF